LLILSATSFAADAVAAVGLVFAHTELLYLVCFRVCGVWSFLS
jgi:hypothetical protein